MSHKHTLLLVDGNALFYRAFHAFPLTLTTPSGELINAVYGFSRIFFSSVKSLKPECVAVCLDMKGPTFRHEQYGEYKATRQKMPEELDGQNPRLRQVIEYLEVPTYQAEGFEADDVIGTIARQATKADPKLHVVILTGDQDLIQLVDEQTSVLLPGIGQKPATMYGPKEVEERYSFSPIQMIEYKALRGDTSDNIPGIPGVGEVTATKLIQEFGSIEKLYTDLEAGKPGSIKGSLLEKITKGKESAFLSHDLATIRTDAPVEVDIDHCKLSLSHPENLITLFKELGFRSLLTELPTSHLLTANAADVFNAEPEEEAPREPMLSDALDAELAPVLRGMEERGVMIDRQYLSTLEKEFTEELESIRKQLFDLAGEEFNPNSPSQISAILYEKLKVPTTFVRKGKTGYTTDAATLQELATEYPIAQVILNFRELDKLQSTYVKPLQEITDEQSRIHTSYTPDTATGRISSKDPNLQNIPVRSEQGMRIRRAFVATPGYTLVAADYSQIELRVAAHLADDKAMKDIFASGRDIHAETAERMGVDRRVAKIINFSVLYGTSAFGFAKAIGVTVPEAKQYIEQYFATYPRLRPYLAEVLELAKKQGYLETMYGRRRDFPNLKASNFQLRSGAEREAMNMPIQGSAADILKRAMCALDAELKKQPGLGYMILTVHDELVLEVPEGKEKEAGELLKKTMTETTTLDVPLAVHVKVGKRWSELESVSD